MGKVYEHAKLLEKSLKIKLEKSENEDISIRKSILEDTFSEIIASDPLFGSVLKIIQRNYNELLVNETNYLKEVNKQLSDEIDIIKDKYEKLIEQLKAQNEIDSKEFSKELAILQNRNKMLTDDIRNLESELQKANEREEMLEALLKDDEDNNANTKPKEKVIHEKISKKKKKITRPKKKPRDFSQGD